jgi:hypothetical protein
LAALLAVSSDFGFRLIALALKRQRFFRYHGTPIRHFVLNRKSSAFEFVAVLADVDEWR